MGKYDPLRAYLSKYEGNEATLTFSQINNIIRPKYLPPSAYYSRQFWENSNPENPRNRHVQRFAWLDAGFKVNNVDFQQRRVTFCKKF